MFATARDTLVEAARRGEFDAGLYYRLGGVTLALPPLRDRAEDVPILVRARLAELSEPVAGEPAGAAEQRRPRVRGRRGSGGRAR